jgi:hypothetical protein
MNEQRAAVSESSTDGDAPGQHPGTGGSMGNSGMGFTDPREEATPLIIVNGGTRTVTMMSISKAERCRLQHVRRLLRLGHRLSTAEGRFLMNLIDRAGL